MIKERIVDHMVASNLRVSMPTDMTALPFKLTETGRCQKCRETKTADAKRVLSKCWGGHQLFRITACRSNSQILPARNSLSDSMMTNRPIGLVRK